LSADLEQDSVGHQMQSFSYSSAHGSSAGARAGRLRLVILLLHNHLDQVS